MHGVGKIGVLCILGAMALTACSDDTPELMNLTNPGNGPEEFGVLPTKPLEMPSNYTSLPTPTPGGSNITDQTPRVDAIVALGGNPNRAKANNGDLVNYASRFRAPADIRSRLAKEDLEWRKQHTGRFLYRAFGVPVYFEAYEEMSLDQYKELERWRQRGVDTPSAPPEPY